MPKTKKMYAAVSLLMEMKTTIMPAMKTRKKTRMRTKTRRRRTKKTITEDL